jgi:quercetin dioxygenase-like cupin family protein
VRELDGLRIIGPTDGERSESSRSTLRELISESDTGGRWSFGEVTAKPDPGVATHIHPGEPEALIILEGDVELHGANGIEHLGPGDVVFVPPDTEHGLRTPTGGRWMAIWPINERVPGKRYSEGS